MVGLNGSRAMKNEKVATTHYIRRLFTQGGTFNDKHLEIKVKMFTFPEIISLTY